MMLMPAHIADTHLTGTPMVPNWEVGVTHHISLVKVKIVPMAISELGMDVASICAANAVRFVRCSVESVRAIMPAASTKAACGRRLKYQALLRRSCKASIVPAMRKMTEPTMAMEKDGV